MTTATPSAIDQTTTALPKPYYQDDQATIYHGDCREILPLLEPGSIDLVLTDPPYGISHRRGKAGDRGKGITKGADIMHGDSHPFTPSILLAFDEIITWGANFYCRQLPDTGRWLIWDKQGHGGSGDFAEAEVAWHSKGRAIKIFRHMWLGVQRDSEVGEARLHPTQKPCRLLTWCIQQSKNEAAGYILDPFMGSGTTLRAAKNLGRKAIGIEIEERYCEIAVKRLAQGVLL